MEDQAHDLQEQEELREDQDVQEASEVGTDDPSNVEETETPAEQTDEEKEALRKELEKLKFENAKLFQRNKTLKSSKTTPNKPGELTKDQRDEIVMLAKGVDEEIIEEAKDLSKAKGIPLSEAIKLPIIQAYQERKEQESRSKQASLGASAKAGAHSEPLIRPNMSREEHMAAWKKMTGN